MRSCSEIGCGGGGEPGSERAGGGRARRSRGEGEREGEGMSGLRDGEDSEFGKRGERLRDWRVGLGSGVDSEAAFWLLGEVVLIKRAGKGSVSVE